MRVVAWNAKVNRSDDGFGDALGNLIRDLNPGVILLQEAAAYVNVMRNRFDNEWRTYAHGDWNESNACPVMVNRRYGKKERGAEHGWDTVRCHTGWTGPNGHKHPGRTWTWVYVDGRFLLSLHRVTGAKKKNKQAAQEEYATLVDYIDWRPGESVVLFGDHNIGPKEKNPDWSSWHIADHVNGSTRFDPDTPGVDYAICRNQKGTVSRKKPYGSDHKAVLLTTDAG